MSKFKNSYNDMPENLKAEYIRKMYKEEKKSFGQIANELNTYANKIRRDAKKFNIPIRTKSEAQKNALSTGTHKHPTKGTERNESTKQKIGKSMMDSWSSLSDKQLKERKNQQKKRWESIPENKKQEMLKKANMAVRTASVLGSKLEKFILEHLIKDGYRVDFHKEQVLSNTKLQLDLFLPTMDVVIEVDGPSHFLPVWGEETLQKNKKYDRKKEGLIIGKGWKIIRIKQTKDFCSTRARITYDRLLKTLDGIKSNKENKILIED